MAPPHSPALRSGGAVSPIAKAKKITGASVKLFKETPLACKRLQSLERTGGFVMSDFKHFLQILGEAERPEVAFV